MLLHVPTFFEKQHNNIREVYTMTKQSDMQSPLRPLQVQGSFGTKKQFS